MVLDMSLRHVFFLFHMRTSYELRISYWSSDVCSSDLRLTQRFVDRRSAMLIRRMAGGAAPFGSVGADGDIVVEGHRVGRLDGFRFVADGAATEIGRASWRARECPYVAISVVAESSKKISH